MDPVSLLFIILILFIFSIYLWKKLSKAFFSSSDVEPEGVMVCPRCGGKDIKSRGVAGDFLSPNYICTSCAYQAAFFPRVTEEEAKKIKSRPAQVDIFHQPLWNDHSKRG